MWFKYSHTLWQQSLYWNISLIWNSYKSKHHPHPRIQMKYFSLFKILLRSSAGMSSFIQLLHSRIGVQGKKNMQHYILASDILLLNSSAYALWLKIIFPWLHITRKCNCSNFNQHRENKKTNNSELVLTLSNYNVVTYAQTQVQYNGISNFWKIITPFRHGYGTTETSNFWKIIAPFRHEYGTLNEVSINHDINDEKKLLIWLQPQIRLKHVKIPKSIEEKKTLNYKFQTKKQTNHMI